MDKKMNHSLLTFCRSFLQGLFLNKKRHRLIIFKGVIVAIIFIFPILCNGSDQKPDTLKQLIDMYDPTSCQECHEEIYAQWQNSHHARSVTGIFMERYLKEGHLSVKSPKEATKKNLKRISPVLNAICHNLIKRLIWWPQKSQRSF